MRRGTGGGADGIRARLACAARGGPAGDLHGVAQRRRVLAAIFFVTARHYGFSPEGNLTLAAVMRYAAAAGAGKLVRRLSSLSSLRAVLVAALAAWGIAALIPLLSPRASRCSGRRRCWRGRVGGDLAAGRELPGGRPARRRDARGRRLVQRHLDTGHRGAAAGDAAVSPGRPLATLALSAAVQRRRRCWRSFGCPGARARTPPEAARAAVGREYGALAARTASWLLPLSYLLSATLAPVLPHRLAAWVAAPRAARWRRSGWRRLLRDAGGRCGAPASGTVAGARWPWRRAPSRRGGRPWCCRAPAGRAGAGPFPVRRRDGPHLLRGAVLLAGGGARRRRRGRHLRGADWLRLLWRAAARADGRAAVAPAHAGTATVALAWVVVAGCSAGALARYLAARRARG